MEKKKNSPEKSSSNKVLVIILGILVVALGGLSAYLYSEMTSTEEVLAKTQKTVKTQESSIAELEETLNNKIADYEELEAQYAALGLSTDSIIAMKEALEKELKVWKSKKYASDAEVKKAKQEMETRLAAITADLATKTEEIARLKLANDSLSASVDSLIVANGFAKDTISNLSEKVAIASILKAENVKISVLNAKDKELVKDEYKAKQIAKVKIQFNLADNKVAKKDIKSIVLQIVEPKGSVLFDTEQGGGAFTKANGHNDFYTKKQNLSFTNTHQAVNFFYEKGSEFDSGEYKIIIFGDGHEIGASSFSVK